MFAANILRILILVGNNAKKKDLVEIWNWHLKYVPLLVPKHRQAFTSSQ